MGLDDATTKMSKSTDAQGHAVRLIDEDKQILKAFKRAVTDSGREIAFTDDPERAGVNNLLTIYRAITGKSEADVVADFAEARGYGDLKVAVAEVVTTELAPIRSRYHELLEDPAELDRLLAKGAARAGEHAETKVVEIKRRMGFALPPAG